MILYLRIHWRKSLGQPTDKQHCLFLNLLVIHILTYFLRNFLLGAIILFNRLIRTTSLTELYESPDDQVTCDYYQYITNQNHTPGNFYSTKTIGLSCFSFLVSPNTIFIPNLIFTVFKLEGNTKLPELSFILFQFNGILSLSR